MSNNISIVWFRQDLRLHDNPALHLAAQHGRILPLYILDDNAAAEASMGEASRVWLHHSLNALDQRLNHELSLFRGDPLAILLRLCQENAIQHVFWNRSYEPWQIKRDTHIKRVLTEHGITVKSSNGFLLWEPGLITKADGTHYKVFTPFYQRGCLQATPPRHPLDTITPQASKLASSLRLSQLALLPNNHWHQALMAQHTAGENAALKALDDFLDQRLPHYQDKRDFPSEQATSCLSAHLHFGELSINHAWHRAQQHRDQKNAHAFCRQLAWREFSYNQLYHHPNLATQNQRPRFDLFPWQDNDSHFKAWCQGRTGIPLVDAGMRQLWQTGLMHNRVRMVTASFLCKNLLIDWRRGERWFRQCLVDADLANNSAGWQWVAGCGADAAPYFRIFNPVLQGQRFDPTGEYVRHFVPELRDLPDRYCHCPWEAPNAIQKAAALTLGQDYPHPIVDLKASRERALAAYRNLPES